MNNLTLAILCLAGLALVTWWLTRPVERWVWPWKPCHNCKRVWRRDEWGNLEYVVPLVWRHGQGGELCPRCLEAATAIEEIERKMSV